jgi:hypothetical protein
MALTEDKEEEERENVYAQLWIWIQAGMLKSSWGAQIPKLDKKENITEQHSLQNTSSENGKPLIDFAQEKSMVIRTTEFLQKDAQGHLGIPRWTRKEPD